MCRLRSSNLRCGITILLIICCLGVVAQGKYGGGTGDPNDPYLIYDANQMQAIGPDANDWDKCFKLMADIDLGQFDGKDDRERFNIIGKNWGDAFTGVFDGNGHTISNFTYTSTGTSYVGLFGYVRKEYAEIKDLVLINPNVDAGTGAFVGLLVGCLEEGTITNCYVEGASVSGSWSVGGLVGQNCGSIAHCYSTADVSGDRDVGGLVGCNPSGEINECYSRGNVWGNKDIGGLVGCNYDDGNYYTGSVSRSYSMGRVVGTSFVGGLIGVNDFCFEWCNLICEDGYCWEDCDEYCLSGDVINCYWDTETSGQATSDGGTGKSTLEMHQQSTFGNWDFINVWDIGEKQTYPYLRTVPAGDINKDKITNFLDLCIVGDQWMKEP
ncbi:MAG: hypothetical protein KAY65_00515 [Planctomycetes bacterium]|nr:hypothetical protein [Planctomycetota bacterium]